MCVHDEHYAPYGVLFESIIQGLICLADRVTLKAHLCLPFSTQRNVNSLNRSAWKSTFGRKR
uniref:Uncharacterized protein n=1 Tax=Romanomermis culicivorax TaxID=13658 RepID=A0A915J322_ROMCU